MDQAWALHHQYSGPLPFLQSDASDPASPTRSPTAFILLPAVAVGCPTGQVPALHPATNSITAVTRTFGTH